MTEPEPLTFEMVNWAVHCEEEDWTTVTVFGLPVAPVAVTVIVAVRVDPAFAV